MRPIPYHGECSTHLRKLRGKYGSDEDRMYKSFWKGTTWPVEGSINAYSSLKILPAARNEMCGQESFSAETASGNAKRLAIALQGGSMHDQEV